MAKIIEVIETSEKRGKGTEKDVVRRVKQLYTKEGKLIFEDDPERVLFDTDILQAIQETDTDATPGENLYEKKYSYKEVIDIVNKALRNSRFAILGDSA